MAAAARSPHADWRPTADEQAALGAVLALMGRLWGPKVDFADLQQALLLKLWRTAAKRGNAGARAFTAAYGTCRGAAVDHTRGLFGKRGGKRNGGLDGGFFVAWHIPDADYRCPATVLHEKQSLVRAQQLLTPMELRVALTVFNAETPQQARSQLGLTAASVERFMRQARHRLEAPDSRRPHTARRLSQKSHACC